MRRVLSLLKNKTRRAESDAPLRGTAFNLQLQPRNCETSKIDHVFDLFGTLTVCDEPRASFLHGFAIKQDSLVLWKSS